MERFTVANEMSSADQASDLAFVKLAKEQGLNENFSWDSIISGYNSNSARI
jgi:hypothetical protein